MRSTAKLHFIAAAVCAFVISASAQPAFAACGTFEVSKGDVKIQKADGKMSDAAVGAKICSGETVIAADAARAKIHMEDGNELNISPNSKITIEVYQYDIATNKKKVMLNILKGKVRATTVRENMYNDKAKDGQANTFQVRTKSAVAGVRGTDFLTSFDPATMKTEIVTFRGKVEVGMPGPSGTFVSSVQVSVGQKTVVQGGQAPAEPKALPAFELKQMNSDSRATPDAASNGANAPGPVAANPEREPAKTIEASPETAAPAPTATGSVGEVRQPASSPLAGSMISTTDLGTNPTVPSMGGIAMPSVPVAPPQIPTLPPQIRDVLTSKNSAVKVKLRVEN